MANFNNRRTFDLGECKYLDFIINPGRKGDTLVITEAQWELLKNGKELESNGECTISGNQISVLLKPQEAEWYVLRVSVSIPPERIITEVEILCQ